MPVWVFYVLGVVLWVCGISAWWMAYRLHGSLLQLSQSMRELANAMIAPYDRDAARRR